jgi:hypothetical protein
MQHYVPMTLDCLLAPPLTGGGADVGDKLSVTNSQPTGYSGRPKAGKPIEPVALWRMKRFPGRWAMRLHMRQVAGLVAFSNFS